jgi:hypothetical protein
MMPVTMRRLPLAALALLVPLALPGTAAADARIHLTPACYQSSETGALTGAGFTPNAVWKARLDTTRRLGSGHVDAHGKISARFTAPIYHGTTGLRTLTISVTDGRHTARTTLQMTPLAATFMPRTGDPATLRVRWRVLGLGPQHGVYVHYLQPDGSFKRTLRIGTTRGPCGTLKTGPIALFPFAYTYGRWTFQVDASRHFSRATLPRLLIKFDVKKPSSAQ